MMMEQLMKKSNSTSRMPGRTGNMSVEKNINQKKKKSTDMKSGKRDLSRLKRTTSRTAHSLEENIVIWT